MSWIIACVLIVPALVVLAARAAGGRPPDPIPRLAALAPPATVVAAGALAAAAVARWWLGLLFAVPAAVLLSWQIPPLRRAGQARRSGGNTRTAEHEGTVLRVLTLNVLVARADPGAIMDRLREHRVDVFAVQELTPEMVTVLEAAGISALLPFSELDARPSSVGTGIWARLPLDPLPPVAGLSTAAPRARIHADGGAGVLVTAVHPTAPTGGKEHRWLADLTLLRQAVARAREPQIVAGDFNATRDHQAFRALLKEGLVDCADAARNRWWPTFTWPNWRSIPPLMRLDHILVTRQHFAIQRAQIVRVPGTDHLGVLAEVTLRPPEHRR